MIKLLTVVAIGVQPIVIGFCGCWFVSPVLLPILPGPARRRDRIAPFMRYFTDPLVLPLSDALRAPARLVRLGWPIVVAGVQAGLARLATTF